MILEAASDLIEGALSVEAASLRLPRRVEFVQMPAEPADQPGSLCYKRFPVVDQQPKLTVWASRRASGRFGSRCAARATASASIGSDLP